MTEKKYEIVSRETLFQGYYRVERFRIKSERFAGGWTRPYSREVLDRGQRCSGVLPFDPQQDKVVLIEQFRPGVMSRDEYPWIIELVAGVSEAGESLEETAIREAREEAGCEITSMLPIMDYYSNPGCTNEHASLFVGRTIAPENGSIYGVESEDEDTRVMVLSTVEALNLLYSKRIRDAATIIALQWFALRHTELRSRWLVSDASTPII
ncbi:MAG: NUDIX domain-containing protein [Alphaproteobacteria bacterium]|nr:NUDIX domain-containing protein [Alphaproteobacteria bacterium]